MSSNRKEVEEVSYPVSPGKRIDIYFAQYQCMGFTFDLLIPRPKEVGADTPGLLNKYVGTRSEDQQLEDWNLEEVDADQEVVHEQGNWTEIEPRARVEHYPIGA